MSAQAIGHTEKLLQISTFYVGDVLYGIDINRVQEINKLSEITPVPLSPAFVRGVVNLRGRIVTVIDLGYKLTKKRTAESSDTKNIIVESKGEYLGLMVDRIWDVVQTDTDALSPPPANIGGVQGRLFRGVIQRDSELVGILDIERILAEETAERE